MKNRYILLIALIIGIVTVLIHAVSNIDKGYTVSGYSNLKIPGGLLKNSPVYRTDKAGESVTVFPNILNQQEKETVSYISSGDSLITAPFDFQTQLNTLLSNKTGSMSPEEEIKEDNEDAVSYPNPTSTSIQYYDGGERVIGNVPYMQSYSFSDEFFYMELKEEIMPQTEVYLEYDLYGVEDNTQVFRSINAQPAFGGYFVKQHEGWSKQREQINPSLLHQGRNTIRFSVPDTAKYSYKIKNLRFSIDKRKINTTMEPTKPVDKNNEALKETSRRLIVNQPTTAYYYQRFGYVQGFVMGEGYDKVEVRIGGQSARTYRGEFEGIAYRKKNKKTEEEIDVLPSQSPWTTTVEAVYPDGEILSVEIRFEQPAQWDHLTGFNPDIHYTEKEVNQEEDFVLRLGTALLEGKAGSVEVETNMSITALRTIDLPRLNPGMVNVTSGYAGYRFLPHGSQFDKPLHVSIGYDSTKLPRGHYAQEIRTYYYDESRSHWVALPRDSVNKEDYLVCSRTTHFTDMINAIVKVPEMPETQEYTPTSLKELQAADPSSGIQLIQAPTANSQGTASLSYPINVPAGRQGLQPNLSINYSSEAANGLLGMGWDMQIPAITVDTKWGTPRYDTANETETYLLNGEELLPSARLEGFISRTSDIQFYPRVESSFEKIIRKGTAPDNYYWIVTDKQGTKYYYGSYGNGVETSVLLKTKDNNKHIAYWPLCKVEDLSGNYMRYCYEIREQTSEYQSDYPETSPDLNNSVVYLGQQLWLEAITYTGYGSEEGAYKVVFSSKDCDVDAARSIGCDVLENTTYSGISSDKLSVDSLSQKKKNILSKGTNLLRGVSFDAIEWDDVPGSDVPEDSQDTQDPDIPDTTCTSGNIHVQVCLESPCKNVNFSGATFGLGTEIPIFQDRILTPDNDSPYPVTFDFSENQSYLKDVSTQDGCVKFMVCPNKTYYLVSVYIVGIFHILAHPTPR